jgi:hypothetical protein
MQAKEKLVILELRWPWSFAGANEAAKNVVDSDEIPREHPSAAKHAAEKLSVLDRHRLMERSRG